MFNINTLLFMNIILSRVLYNPSIVVLPRYDYGNHITCIFIAACINGAVRAVLVKILP